MNKLNDKLENLGKTVDEKVTDITKYLDNEVTLLTSRISKTESQLHDLVSEGKSNATKCIVISNLKAEHDEDQPTLRFKLANLFCGDKPADGKRRLIRGAGWFARISDDYKPQRPVVGEDIPGPAVPCHVGTARLLATVDRRTRTIGRAVRRPYSDSDDSDNDVLYVEGHAPMPTAVELLFPPVVTQTKPMEGCDPASPRRLRQGRDVLTEDGTVAVDTRQVSISLDIDVVNGIHMMSECIPTVTPKLTAAPQAASEVAQMRPRGYCRMNLLPSVGEGAQSLDVDAPDAVAS